MVESSCSKLEGKGEMSLALIQDYSSAEEEEEVDEQFNDYHHSSDDQDEASTIANPSTRYSSIFNLPKPSEPSALPSAFDAFSQISGPPQFLNNSVEEKASTRGVDYEQSKRRSRKKQDLPIGAIMESKAQLVGIHERVRSDIEGNQPPSSVSSTAQGVKRVATAANPNAEDAAELLRMCLQCGIPKTYSNARGMVCPVCGDRPPVDTSNETKKKGSAIKEKEKSKRMRGQSSHSTWKSETEMQLRQQFD